MAVFSGIHHIEHKPRKILWLATSAASAYILTIFVNGTRIIVSIYFYAADIYSEWVTPERVHRFEGTLIYFFFLCLFYTIIKKILNHCSRRGSGKGQAGLAMASTQWKYFRWSHAGSIPLLWYGLVTIIVPLANGAYRDNGARFAEHSWTIISGCFIVIAAIFLFQIVRNCCGKRAKNHETKDSYR
jgi:hypothetical protein